MGIAIHLAFNQFKSTPHKSELQKDLSKWNENGEYLNTGKVRGGFFDMSALKNELVLDFIISPIKRGSKCQNFWHFDIFRADQSKNHPVCWIVWNSMHSAAITVIWYFCRPIRVLVLIRMNCVNHLVTESLPGYLKGLPIPNSVRSHLDLTPAIHYPMRSMHLWMIRCLAGSLSQWETGQDLFPLVWQ